MPVFTLRLDSKKDDKYIKVLEKIMDKLGHKSATKTYEYLVHEHSKTWDYIQELEEERKQLRGELEEYKNAVEQMVNAQKTLNKLIT